MRPVADGLQLFVRLTPGARKDDIDGTEEGANGRIYLKVRVRAVAEKGKANTALVALLAKRGAIAKSNITIVSGHTSRMKTLLFQGETGTMRETAAKLLQ